MRAIITGHSNGEKKWTMGNAVEDHESAVDFAHNMAEEAFGKGLLEEPHESMVCFRKGTESIIVSTWRDK